MAVKAHRDTVGTDRVDLTPTAAAGGRRGIAVDVKVLSGSTIFVGGADVTAAAGRPVEVGESYVADLGQGDRLFAVTASGTAAVSVLRTGV